MPPPDASVVRGAIERAFADVTYPGDDHLCDPTSDDEGVADYFRGRAWAGHRVTDLRFHSCALSFLTDPALHYYLPAFMLAVLEDRVAADVLVLDVISLLGSPWGRIGWLLSRLSAPQRDAIRAYLLHQRAADRAEAAGAGWTEGSFEPGIGRALELFEEAPLP